MKPSSAPPRSDVSTLGAAARNVFLGSNRVDGCCSLRFMDRDAAETAERVRDGLRRAAIPVEESGDIDDPCQIWLILFSCVTPNLLSWIRDTVTVGRTLLLAIASPGSAALDEHGWRLLEAGATDAFAWDHSNSPEFEVRCRLERFLQVDALMQSPVVTEQLVGASQTWTTCIRQIVEIAAFSQASVMITGESGTGKELVARLIHRLDARSPKKEDLVILDCTTVVPELSGSEFFGHERGAFTGASNGRDGALAIADGGSLFLDEVGELPLRLQAELLRAVQERAFKKVGSNRWEVSNYRLICATHRNLLDEQAQGRFRQDFYFRIASWMCRLPTLDERRGDIPALTKHFMRKLRPDWEPELDEPVERYLTQRAYPGNVRDLRQLVERLMHRHVGDGPITVGDLPIEERRCAPVANQSLSEGLFDASAAKALAIGIGLKDIGRMAEESAVRLAVQDAQGNLQLAAQKLAVSDRALQMRRAQKSIRGLSD